MDICYNELLALTKRQTSTVSNINVANVDASLKELSTVSNINVKDTATINGKDVDLFGVISDERLEELYSSTSLRPKNFPTKTIRFATTYKNMNSAQISHIKQLIYDMLVENGTAIPGSGGTGGTGGAGGTGSGTGGTGADSNPGVGASFISEFGDTKSMFTWLKSNKKVASETQITRAELVALT